MKQMGTLCLTSDTDKQACDCPPHARPAPPPSEDAELIADPVQESLTSSVSVNAARHAFGLYNLPARRLLLLVQRMRDGVRLRVV